MLAHSASALDATWAMKTKAGQWLSGHHHAHARTWAGARHLPPPDVQGALRELPSGTPGLAGGPQGIGRGEGTPTTPHLPLRAFLSETPVALCVWDPARVPCTGLGLLASWSQAQNA